MTEHSHGDDYQKNSLSLFGAVAMGTGVMIGAGLFALTGQLAQHAGGLFPLAFVSAAIVCGFSAYTYVKVCAKYPSAGGIAMILQKCYGPGVVTAGCSLLMYFSMVINESLVARTFGTYTMQLFGGPNSGADASGGQTSGGTSGGWLIPALGVGLIAVAFVVNILGNAVIGSVQKVMAVVKVLGIAALAVAGLWASGFSFETVTQVDQQPVEGVWGFLTATAIGILAYKGFTTITNDGDEVTEPKKNVGRAIMISIGVCIVVYVLVAFAVAGSLSLDEIINAKDYALAEAARPAFGNWGVWMTVSLAIVATVSGLIASVFAVSRMLAMLTDMQLVPHRHFGMPGRIQKHTLVYTVVLAAILTIFLDLSRIAAIGAIFYIVMDMAIHWGVLRHLRKDVGANAAVLIAALVMDAAVLGALLVTKGGSDPLVLIVSAIGFVLIFGGEWWFLKKYPPERGGDTAQDS
jgi:amino acid transporter